MATSAEIRDELVQVLRLDLVGPEPGSAHESEVLPQSPSRWYLTGFLVPYEAREAPRKGEPAQEEFDEVTEAGGGDDETVPERASGRRAFFPSSIGVSLLVPTAATVLGVSARWGDYAVVEPEGKEGGEGGGGTAVGTGRAQWRRAQRLIEIQTPVDKVTAKPVRTELPGGGGMALVTSIRPVSATMGLPAGTRSVAVFLVNYRRAGPDERRDESIAFQAGLTLRTDQGFVPRPNLRGLSGSDWDEQVADLQYRDTFEYGVGHGVATTATLDLDGSCREITTTWIPSAEVEKVEPASVPAVELRMEALAATPTAAALRKQVGAFVSAYTAWIGTQRAKLPPDPPRAKVAEALLKRAEFAGTRIADGLTLLDDPKVFEAFRLANRSMGAAARQRAFQQGKGAPESVEAPSWRPFQLAFLLMNLRGIADPTHADRGLVDLLFFPTGGGKTEAYFGLAAFALVLRRLRHPGVAPAGVSVLMRYTLRLLTLDQLSRAATLICALENERVKDVTRLGTWPFEIGLWVGQAATPNRMGRLNDGDRNSARARTIEFQNNDKKPSPIPLENCPWCGTKFKATSFILQPNPATPTDLRIVCANRHCPFKGDRPLPIVAVDEPLYRRLPCFVIATVDKFASLPWVGRTGALFGKVERFDKDGFYGPCDPGRGAKLERPLLPPDLIIQDELHLISGPLGTMVGLYETAIDALASREEAGVTTRPKIVASTATVRRAEAQIDALFARSGVEIFPPPGPDRRDSFFAVTVPSSVKHARRYVGIAAQGRSLKVVLLRTYLALLAAGQRAYLAEGGARNKDNLADPYMTLVGYFNSLRELGGSRRIVEDEVNLRLSGYDQRLRVGEVPGQGPFARRQIAYEVVELTSRESTDRVAGAKRRLALPIHEKDRVDVALATNMISVGLDITRLGLMVVLGQPKMTAEYIQATSRVGRDDARPGLVVTLLNIHRPRDRSHYERFEAYHATFYRAVEATSVTPFSPRAVDRAIAAVTVTLARHGCGALTPPRRAVEILKERANLGFVPRVVASRAERHDRRLTPQDLEELRLRLTSRVTSLLDDWSKVAKTKYETGAGLQYNPSEETGAPPLLFDPLDPELLKQSPEARRFRAHRSLRDVEPNVNLWVRRLDGVEVEGAEE